MKNKITRLWLTIVTIMAIGACAGIGSNPHSTPSLKTSAKVNKGRGKYTAVVMGKITRLGSLKYPLVVVAYPLNPSFRQKNEQFDYVILDDAGEYMLSLPEGEYHLYTIVDFNNNNLFEKSEISGWYGKGAIVSLQAGDVVAGVDIESASTPGKLVEFPAALGISYNFDSQEYGWKNGQIIKIYDAIFSVKNAEIGLWSPEDFFRVFGANIFLLEDYDPSKIPILFVHGIKGSPQDWIPFLIRMDRNRYQPWFFYYPSGMRLHLVSRILFEKLSSLQKEFKFSSMCLTAHSMGGFVTQTLLTDYDFEKEVDYIKLYITLATPWSGFESADAAVATSPVVLPSWIDIASRSIFIKKLLKRPLPESVSYYLFYGKNDTVSGGKALDERVFTEATGKLGFDVTHQSILSDKKVFLQYEQLLKKHLP